MVVHITEWEESMANTTSAAREKGSSSTSKTSSDSIAQVRASPLAVAIERMKAAPVIGALNDRFDAWDQFDNWDDWDNFDNANPWGTPDNMTT
jgi:hypothetical protein